MCCRAVLQVRTLPMFLDSSAVTYFCRIDLAELANIGDVAELRV
jgi:hypothetical protein